MQDCPSLVSCKPLKTEFNTLKKISITSPEFTVGRSLNNSAVIPCIYISRNHCKIQNIGNEWFIHDLSAAGIEVNSNKLGKGKTIKLSDGDVIRLEQTNEFIYKFILHEPDPYYARKKIKLEPNNDDEIINNMKIKFEQSQDYTVKNLEVNIQNAKHKQNTYMLLKEQLQSNMIKKTSEVEENFTKQIINLKGEKFEIEQQKAHLEKEKNEQLDKLKEDMGTRIAELMEQIKKHNEIESDLLLENNNLKEKLLQERDEFLSELSRESASKQDLFNRLDEKVKEQEEKLKEKQDLEETLRKETEQLRLAKEKELNELAEAKSKREQELIAELDDLRKSLEERVTRAEQEKQQTKEQLKEQIEELRKVNDEDKVKVEELMKEREEMQKLLIEAPQTTQKYIEELQTRVAEREIELATLAAERIQQQADQSGAVIKSLQEQLEKVKNQLHNVEKEKETLENCPSSTTLDVSSTSKTIALTEFGEMMESELQCSICAELFITSTTLSCSHTFCKYCITMWKRKKNDCPVCRAPIVSECRSLVLDSFIEKAVQSLTPEMKNKRDELLKNREELDARLAQDNISANKCGRSIEDDYSESDLEESFGEEEEEEEYPLFEGYTSYEEHDAYDDFNEYSSDGGFDFDDGVMSEFGSEL